MDSTALEIILVRSFELCARISSIGRGRSCCTNRQVRCYFSQEEGFFMRRSGSHLSLWASVLIMAFTLAPLSAGVLTLTAAGVADGFTLTTFATLNPGLVNTGNFGPFGVAVSANGNIIVSNEPNATRYAFADVDGQTTATALNHVPSSSGTLAYATAGGQAYGGDGSGHFVQFNNDGTVNHVLTGVTASTDLGMWGNPTNGHIIANSSAGLIDIDPLANGGTGSFRVI